MRKLRATTNPYSVHLSKGDRKKLNAIALKTSLGGAAAVIRRLIRLEYARLQDAEHSKEEKSGPTLAL